MQIYVSVLKTLINLFLSKLLLKFPLDELLTLFERTDFHKSVPLQSVLTNINDASV